MFSSSTKICLIFLSIFILFQLNNGDKGGCPGGPPGPCLPHSNCHGNMCITNSQCCDGLVCKAGEFWFEEIMN